MHRLSSARKPSFQGTGGLGDACGKGRRSSDGQRRVTALGASIEMVMAPHQHITGGGYGFGPMAGGATVSAWRGADGHGFTPAEKVGWGYLHPPAVLYLALPLAPANAA